MPFAPLTRPRSPLRDAITVLRAGEQGIRFLVASGKPIREPVACYDPIAMNKQAEIAWAVAELRARSSSGAASAP